jgi:hypothetical protein
MPSACCAALFRGLVENDIHFHSARGLFFNYFRLLVYATRALWYNALVNNEKEPR